MKKMFVIMTLVLISLGLMFTLANANVTFTFDKTYNSSLPYPSIGVGSDWGAPWTSDIWGTITLDDNGALVDVSIDLVDAYTIDRIYFNYGGTGAPIVADYDSTRFTLDSFTVTHAENLQAADGYPGRFDVKIGSFDPDLSEPYSGSLKLDNGSTNLDVAYFYQKDDLDLVYAAMRINNVNLWGGPGTTGTGSAWIFASTALVSIPEPTTLLLLGIGLLSIVGLRRKE